MRNLENRFLSYQTRQKHLQKRKQLGRKLGEVRLRRIRNMELAGLITQNMVMQRLKKELLAHYLEMGYNSGRVMKL